MSAKDSISLDPVYAEKFGRALFAFSRLEWQAVWCCERIKPGSIEPLEKRTAKSVAMALEKLVDKAPEAVRPKLAIAAKRFAELVEIRNGLAHGRPCTAPDGEQRLSRNGEIWTPESIDTAADRFAECGAELNRLYYEWLMPKQDSGFENRHP